MSTYTTFCKAQAESGFASAARWPSKFYELRTQQKQRESTVNKAGTGCIGFLLVGIVVFFIPLICMLAVEAVVLAWALAWSLLYAVGCGVDRLSGHAEVRHV